MEYVKPHKDIGVIFYYKHQGVIDNGHKESDFLFFMLTVDKLFPLDKDNISNHRCLVHTLSGRSSFFAGTLSFSVLSISDNNGAYIVVVFYTIED